MKTNINIKISLIILLVCIGFMTQAQTDVWKRSDNVSVSGLEIEKVFNKYGFSEEGVDMALTQNEKYIYRGIMIENNPEAEKFAISCIEKDKAKAKSVKEVFSGGKISTIYLKLEEKDDLHRFILFNKNKGMVTLVYIESNNKDILKIILKKN